jgi:hypothetical protein
LGVTIFFFDRKNNLLRYLFSADAQTNLVVLWRQQGGIQSRSSLIASVMIHTLSHGQQTVGWREQSPTHLIKSHALIGTGIIKADIAPIAMMVTQ